MNGCAIKIRGGGEDRVISFDHTYTLSHKRNAQGGIGIGILNDKPRGVS